MICFVGQCWHPTVSDNETCSVTNRFPINKSTSPKDEVHSHQSPKVDDFVCCPSPVLHSTSDTFVPRLTILFDIRKHVCVFLAFLRSAAVGPPTVVHGPDPRCEQAASVADTQRAPSLIGQEKPRHIVRHVQHTHYHAGGVAADDRDYHRCFGSHTWSTRCIHGTFVVAEALQRRLEQLVGICHFPRVQEVRWPSIKKGRSTLQCMSWPSTMATYVRRPSSRGRFFVCGNGQWNARCIISIQDIIDDSIFFLLVPSTLALSTLFPLCFYPKEIRSHQCEAVFNPLRCSWSESSYKCIGAINCKLKVRMTFKGRCYRVERRAVSQLYNYFKNSWRSAIETTTSKCWYTVKEWRRNKQQFRRAPHLVLEFRASKCWRDQESALVRKRHFTLSCVRHMMMRR